MGLRVRFLEWYMKHGDAKRWNNKRSINAYLKVFRRALASAQWFLLLKTPTNSQMDWLTAGRVYVRISLAASSLGLLMHPYSQVLQEYTEMSRLQREFNSLMNIRATRRCKWPFAWAEAQNPTTPTAGTFAIS
jgi:hypothetical protein